MAPFVRRRIASFADVDHQILKYRATQFKKAASAGSKAPQDMSLPCELIARERQRDETRAATLAAEQAHANLVIEREQLEGKLRKVDQKVSIDFRNYWSRGRAPSPNHARPMAIALGALRQLTRSQRVLFYLVRVLSVCRMKRSICCNRSAVLTVGSF